MIFVRAVITVVGKDRVGILAKVSSKCAEFGINIIEVTQSVLQEMFCMIMLGDIQDINISFDEFAENLKKMGEEMNMEIRCMHEDIFNSMHRI